MRIISGIHKGKRLNAPKKLPVRPTTDMAKESLFNILNNKHYFDELTILELFAGTGNISYEFGSRGATEIVAIDAHAGCVNYIDKTSKELDLNITAIKSDVFKYLSRVHSQYDIIFADPPYALPIEDFTKIIELVFANNMLLENGQLIIEHSKHMDLSSTAHFTSQRKYGGSAFSFFDVVEEES